MKYASKRMIVFTKMTKHTKTVVQRQKSPLCPLTKFWCAVHRSNLAWASVTSSVSDVKLVLPQLAPVGAFFHRSGIRTRKLRQNC